LFLPDPFLLLSFEGGASGTWRMNTSCSQQMDCGKAFHCRQ